MDALDAELRKKQAAAAPRRISFVPASKEDLKMAALKKKYKPINRSSAARAPADAEAMKGKKKEKTLYRRGAMRALLRWQVPHVGAGYHNLGNTCFLNSVLQCMVHTAPLLDYLLNQGHPGACKVSGFCMMCAMCSLGKRAMHKATAVVAPKKIVKNMRAIGKQFRFGRQEDSHEFLRAVVEKMQEQSLGPKAKKMAPALKKTTFIHQLFGGTLRSRVQCKSCQYCSDTFDPFMDLSLEIRRCQSVGDALKRFTAKEYLDNDNQYKCEKCKKYVHASKRFTVHSAPPVLVIHLKRFSFAGFGKKISRHVAFAKTLKLAPYCSSKKQAPSYVLYGVLVHSGSSSNSGHYFCFVANKQGDWFRMDDSSVSRVSEKTVMKQNAYILFYRATEHPALGGEEEEEEEEEEQGTASARAGVPPPAPGGTARAVKLGKREPEEVYCVGYPWTVEDDDDADGSHAPVKTTPPEEDASKHLHADNTRKVYKKDERRMADRLADFKKSNIVVDMARASRHTKRNNHQYEDASVVSWELEEAGKSAEVQREALDLTFKKKRKRREQTDYEYDLGRVPKKKKQEEDPWRQRRNPFQSVQNAKNAR